MPVPELRVVAVCLAVALIACLAMAGPVQAAGYQHLKVCVYFRYQETQSIPDNLDVFARQWADIEKQVHVDKVYLETTRNGQLATEASVVALKKFFGARGIKVSGGLGLTANEPNGFESYCYTAPADRDKVKAMVEFTARHFDEIILDDFYFNNSKTASDVAAKGNKSWSQFRCELMAEVSKNLIIGPAKAVNPNVHLIIKFPNWYEAFQGLGYDLAAEPKLFDAIYTGTETRNPNGGQRLQPYQSYLQTVYFNNIKPGRNQGGWIDGGGDVERYAEQFWNTFFAKVPEIMLFNSVQISARLNAPAGATDPAATLAGLMKPATQPDGSAFAPTNVARIAGYSAELLDGFLGKLGNPVGIATYKPCNSLGEEYLPNYLGMIGVPVNLVPDFPTDAPAVLLTEASAHDPDLVAKTEKFVMNGGRAIATTKLMEKLGDKGFGGLAEIHVTGARVLAKSFPAGGGRGQRAPLQSGTPTTAPADLDLLIPQMRHQENDAWPALPFNTAASGSPMVIAAAYGKGTFYALAVPDDFADLYRLPPNALNGLRQLLGTELFVNLDAPDHVSLFAYDNRTLIVQNYQSKPVTARVAVTNATRLRDLLNDETLAASSGNNRTGNRPGNANASNANPSAGRRGISGNGGASFEMNVPAHSFRVFAAE